MIKELFKFIIRNIFKFPLNYLLKKNKILIIFRQGNAIGDHVYMSSVIREIYKKNYYKIFLFTNYYEFYINNPRVYKLFKIKKSNSIWSLLYLLKGEMILEFRSIYKNYNNEHFLINYLPKNLHLAQGMSNHFNLGLDYKNLQNEIFFSNKEIKTFEKKINLPNDFALIQSSAKSFYTKNKEWNFSGMQKIIDHFDKFNWIQIGKNNEPKLKNCNHLLDLNFRELSYVISKSRFLVVYEGLLNHIASCFNKKTFVIHLGFLHEDSFKYPNNVIINQNENLKCYPCYLLDCKNHKSFSKNFMSDEFVINAIEKNM